MSFLNRLELDQPLSGRRVKENGEAFNEADHFQQERWSTLSQAAEAGELFRVFETAALAIGEKRTYVLNIPVGYTVRGFARFATVKEGTILAQYLTAAPADKGSVLATMSPRNFDQRQSQPNKLSVTKLERVASVANATAESPQKEVYSSANTATRAASTQTEAGGVVPLDSTVLPVFTVENIGGAGTTYTIELYFSEIAD